MTSCFLIKNSCPIACTLQDLYDIYLPITLVFQKKLTQQIQINLSKLVMLIYKNYQIGQINGRYLKHKYNWHVICTKKAHELNYPNLYMNNTTIAKVNHHKHLGLILNSNTNLFLHIDEVTKIAYKRVTSMKKVLC